MSQSAVTPLSYSVVVLYYRLGLEFKETLSSLLLQTTSPTEVIVVDNASNDGVLRIISKDFGQIRFVTAPSNLGYAGGMNFGYSELSADVEFVLFMTHEVDMDRSCVETMLSETQLYPLASQLGPVLERTGTREVWSSGGQLQRNGGVSHRTIGEPLKTTAWLDGACTLIRTSAFETVGGWDTRFYLYWEDVDISLRLSEIGPVQCVPGATARQETGTAPVYFAIRNRILLWKIRKSRANLVMSLFHALAQLVVKDRFGATPMRRVIARARIRGLIDGFSGRLSKDQFHVRELEAKP